MDTHISEPSRDTTVSQTSDVVQRTDRWRTLVVSGGAAFLTLLAAVAGSFVTGTRMGTLAGGVESLVSVFSAFLSSVASLIPLGYAYGAGMVATVNPCGFAMLPAYLGLYLGANAAQGLQGSSGRRLHRLLLADPGWAADGDRVA